MRVGDTGYARVRCTFSQSKTFFIPVFRDSSVLVYSFAGLNSVFGSQYLNIYHDDDKCCAPVVRPFFEKES